MDSQPLSAEAPSPLPPAGPGNRATAPATLADDGSDNPSADPSTDTPEPDTGDPSTGDPSTGDPSTGDPSTGDPSTGDPSTASPFAGDEGGPIEAGHVRISFLWDGDEMARADDVPYYILKIGSVTLRAWLDDQPEVSWFRRLPPGPGAQVVYPEFTSQGLRPGMGDPVEGWHKNAAGARENFVSFDINVAAAAIELSTPEGGVPEHLDVEVGFAWMGGQQVFAASDTISVFVQDSEGRSDALDIPQQGLDLPVPLDLGHFSDVHGGGDFTAANRNVERMLNADTVIVISTINDNLYPYFMTLP